MSRGQTLRALVNERLAAAAEDIFVLFERTIVEYEEELCRSKEENQRNIQIISSSPDPGLDQEITETPWIKEEPEEESFKQEEEQLQVPVPESSAVSVETEESSLLQQRQTGETQGEDISSETHFYSETDHWEPFRCPEAQIETEVDGDHNIQVQIRDRKTELFPQHESAPETSVHSGHMSGADRAERKKHQCAFCNKRFGTKQHLKYHIRVHTGEKPYSCSICKKTFSQKGNLYKHKRTHTGETIAKYEEELCRSKEEKQRKQQLLDKDLYPRIQLVRVKVQIPSTSPDPGLDQEIEQTPLIKEEPEEQNIKSVKKEENHLPMPVPESSAVCVEPEESSLLQQRQTEETQGEDISSETHFYSETDHWEPFSWSAAQMETEADGDDYNQVQIRDRSTGLSPQYESAPETSVHSGHMSGADGAERKRHQCHVCNKRFVKKQHLQNHIRVHTGEKPYSCLICRKAFSQKGSLELHKRTHTGEKPFRCSICEKSFARKDGLNGHKKTHTGEKPHSCSICGKTFSQKGNLYEHKRTHTGEKPYSCSICKKTFSHKSCLNKHQRKHTGEKPYSC